MKWDGVILVEEYFSNMRATLARQIELAGKFLSVVGASWSRVALEYWRVDLGWLALDQICGGDQLTSIDCFRPLASWTAVGWTAVGQSGSSEPTARARYYPACAWLRWSLDVRSRSFSLRPTVEPLLCSALPVPVDLLSARAGGAADHLEHGYKAQAWRCSMLCNPADPRCVNCACGSNNDSTDQLYRWQIVF